MEITALERLETPRAFNVFTEFGRDEKAVSTDAGKFASYSRGLRQYALRRGPLRDR